MSQSNNSRHAILGHPPEASQRMYSQSNYGNNGSQQMMYPNSTGYSGNGNYQLPQRGSNRDGQMHPGMPPNKNHGNQSYGFNQPPPMRHQQQQQQQQYNSNYYNGPQDMYCNFNGVVNNNSRYGQMEGQYPPMNPGFGPNYMDQNGKFADC